MDFFRDSLWQFAISISVTIIFGILSIVFFLVQLNTKRLIYEIISYKSVLGSWKEFEEKAQFLFNGQKIEYATLATIRITNYGREAIRAADYNAPLKFYFNNADVLGTEIIKTEPKNLNVSLKFDSKNVFLEPVLLNNKDEVTFNVLLSQFDGNISVFSRIAGIKRIFNAEEAIMTRFPFLLRSSAIAAAIASSIAYIIYTILIISHFNFMHTCDDTGPPTHQLICPSPVYASPTYLPITIFLVFVSIFTICFLILAFPGFFKEEQKNRPL
jgi:hypothetical protein